MSSRRDGGTADAEQSAPKGEEQNTGTQPASTSLIGGQDSLLNLARDMGHIIGEPLRTTPESSETEETETESVTDEGEDEATGEADTDTQPEIADAEGEETEEESSEEELPAAKERKSIEEQIKQFETQGKKAPWYLSRIAKETRLKNERTAERDRVVAIAQEWKVRAENAETQLQNGAGAATTQTDPLSNVFSAQGLQQKKLEAEKWVAWAERNRNGGEAVVGKDAQGNDETRYLNEEEVTNLKLGCEKVLREGIPNRTAYLMDMDKSNNVAVDIYKEYKDSNSNFTKEALGMFEALRQGFIPPDIMVWIGHAITGRNLYLQSKNGSGKKSDPAKRIVESARTKVAPTTTKSRGFVPRIKSADLDTARKNLQEKGDADSALKWLEAKGFGGNRSKRPELVEK